VPITVGTNGAVPLTSATSATLKAAWDGSNPRLNMGDPETVLYSNPVTFQGFANIFVDHLEVPTATTAPVTTLFAGAGNKTIQMDLTNTVFSVPNSTLTVTNGSGTAPNFSGYGLQFINGSFSLATIPTITVANATNSNVIQGLTISSQVTGTPNNGAPFTKNGLGALVLDNTTNNFISNILITQGVVSVASDLDLGNAANIVVLNPSTGTTPTSTLRFTDNVTTSRTIQLLGTANTRAIEVVAGKTVQINSPFDFAGVSAPTVGLSKNDSGTLILNAANPTWNGTITINGGIIRDVNPAALGTGAIVVNSATGSALQLSGGITVTNALTLNTTTASGGIDSGGQLQSLVGVNTYAGPITQTAGVGAFIGAAAGATLNITGGDFATNSVQFNAVGNGVINLQSTYGLTGTAAAPVLGGGGPNFIKIGQGTLNVLSSQQAVTSVIAVNNGTMVIKGSGVTFGGGSAVINLGTLSIDDSSGTPSAHLGGRTVTLQDGTFNYIGNTSGSAESFGALAIGTTGNAGASTISAVVGSGATSTLTFASLAFVAGNTLNFAGDFGTATGTKVLFTAQANTALLNRVTVTNAANTSYDFAAYTTTGGIAVFTAYSAVTDINNAVATDTVKVGTGFTTSTNLSASRTLNALAFTGNNLTVSGNTGTILTLTSGNVLATGGSLATPDTLSVPIVALAAAEGIFSINSGTALQLGTGAAPFNETGGSITGTGGLTKTGGGSLLLDSAQFYTGATSVNGGTLQLVAGATNTLLVNQRLNLSGGTLDLNGGVQSVGDFTSVSAINGGTLTNTNATNAIFLTNMTTTTAGGLTFAGQVTSNVNFQKSGVSTLTLTNINSYSGRTIINGGTLILTDSAELSGTSGNVMSQPGAALTATNSFTPASLIGLSIGQLVTSSGGTGGFSANTVITGINTSTGVVTLSNAATAGTPTNIQFASSAIEIDNATLSIVNSGLKYDANRVPDGAGITLNSGGLSYTGRSQVASLETVGAVQLARGASTITVANSTVVASGGTSATLQLGGLTQVGGTGANGATVNFIGTGGTLGQIGNNPRVLISGLTSTPFIGGWAIVNGTDFAGYNQQTGVGALNALGYAGYDGSTPVGATSTQNIKTVAPTTITANTHLNSIVLSVAATGQNDLGFASGNTVLDVVGGGILKTGVSGSIGLGGNGIITRFGSSATDVKDLYITNNNAGTGDLNIENDIRDGNALTPNTGQVRLILTAVAGTIFVDGAGDNFTGGTVVNGSVSVGSGILGNSVNGVVVNNGTLTIQNGGNTNIGATNFVEIHNGNIILNGSNKINGLRLFNDGSTGVDVKTNGTNAVTTITDTITVTPTSVGGGVGVPLYAPAVLDATNGGAIALGANRIVNVAANTIFNGTSNVDVAPLQSGLTITAPIVNIVSPSPVVTSIIKQGAGVLQLDNALSTFSGGVTLQAGTLSLGASSTPNNSSFTSGPLGTGALTITGNSTMILAAIQAPTIWNNVLMTSGSGSTLNFNIAANGTSAFSVPTPVTLTLAGGFQLPFTSANDTLNIGVINPNMTVIIAGNITAQGGQTFEDSGTIAKTGLGNLVLNASFSGTVTGSGPISLFTDGNLPGGPIPQGTSTPETVSFGTISMTGPTTINVGRLGITYNPLYPLAANKTVSLSGLTLNGVLTVTNSVANTSGVSGGGSYGLQVGGTGTVLSNNQVINVTTATASNVVQGLTFSAPVSGSVATVTLTGPGTAVFAGANSGFIGNITVINGVLGATIDSALGNSNNNITLNGNATTAGFEAFGTFTSTRNIIFGNATATNNVILVARGQTLTLGTPGQLTGSIGFVKADPGTLLMTAQNTGFSGAVTINGGAIQVTNDKTLGTNTVTVGNVIGAALQLANLGNTYTGTVAINSTGINNAGAIQSVGNLATNVFGGVITVSTTGAAVGADLGNTLSLNPSTAIGGANTLNFTNAGTINIGGSGIGASLINQLGSGNTTITVADTAFTGALTVSNGRFVASGLGTMGAGSISLVPGGTLVLDDNTGAITASRLGNRTVTMTGGTLEYDGNATTAASQATTGALTINRSGGIISLVPGTASPAPGPGMVLTFGSLAAFGADSAVVFTGNGIGGALNQIKFTTAPTLTNNIFSARATVLDSTNSLFGFATYGANGVAVLSTFSAVADINAALTTDNVKIGTGFTTSTNLTANKTINTLSFSGNGLNLTGNTNTSFNVTTGGILSDGGNNTLSVPLINLGATQAVFHVNAGGTLTVSSSLNGTGGLVKADGGTLLLAPSAGPIAGLSANALTGNVSVDGGTLQLGANNALFPGQFLVVDAGTFDLNGFTQQISGLLTEAGSVNGGIITSSTSANLVINNDANARTFAGNIAGSVNLTRGGQISTAFTGNSTTNGIFTFNGGTSIIKDAGTLSATTGVNVSYSTLQLDNTGTMQLDRINDSAPITLRGASLTLLGRSGMISTENLGAVTAAQGNSTVTVTIGAAGLSEAQLNLLSLAPSAFVAGTVDAGTVNFVSSSGTLGAMGSAGRVLVTALAGQSTLAGTTLNLTHMIGGWAVVGTDFASYNDTFGIGALAGVGYAGYDVTNNTAGVGWGTYTQNQNLLVTTAFSNSLPSPGVTINALKVGGFTFAMTPGAVLNLKSGGLILSGTANTFDTSGNGGILTAGGPTTVGGAGVAGLYLWNNTAAYVMNARITDNPASGDKVRVVINAGGGSIALTDSGDSLAPLGNSYTGGTVVNSGTLILSAPSVPGNAVIPAGGVTVNGGAALTMSVVSGQINSANVITVNGPGTVTLFGNNTLAGLAINNVGGGGTGLLFPTITSTSTTTAAGANQGTLTLTGSTAITATSNYVGSVAVLNGRIAFGAGVNTIDIEPITVNGLSTNINPLVATLNVQSFVGATATIHKTGGGVLGFTTPDTYTGDTAVDAGGILIAAANGGSRYSEYMLASGTSINLAGQSTTLGGLSGSGVVFNSGVLGTLTVGFDNHTTTFSGQFTGLNLANLNVVNLAKIGSGTMTLTGQAIPTSTIGTFAIAGGGVTYSGLGSAAFSSYTVTPTGTLTLDNGTTNVNNRLNGNASSTIPNVTLGGNLTILGNGSATTTENINVLTIVGGGGAFTLAPAGQNMTVNLTTLAAAGSNTGGSSLFRGTNLGGTTGVTTNIILANAAGFNAPAGQGGGLNGTTNMTIRPDIIADTSATGTGIGFLTRDTTTGALRVLTNAEMAANFTSNATTNYQLTNTSTGTVLTTNGVANSLVLGNGGGLSLGVAGAQIGVTLTTGGVLAEAGNTGLNIDLMTAANNQAFYMHVAGAGTTLNVGANLYGTGGLVKAGAGTLNLNSAEFYTGTTFVNEGILNLSSTVDNTIMVTPGSGLVTTPVLQALSVNGTAIVDLNGGRRPEQHQSECGYGRHDPEQHHRLAGDLHGRQHPQLHLFRFPQGSPELLQVWFGQSDPDGIERLFRRDHYRRRHGDPARQRRIHPDQRRAGHRRRPLDGPKRLEYHG
jgi:autotransporter-associated beta strand protein